MRLVARERLACRGTPGGSYALAVADVDVCRVAAGDVGQPVDAVDGRGAAVPHAPAGEEARDVQHDLGVDAGEPGGDLVHLGLGVVGVRDGERGDLQVAGRLGGEAG